MFEKERAEAAQRSIDRRRVEDSSPRLKKEVPSLLRLRVAVNETGGLGANKHLRHIVVPSAPALFVFTCGDEHCRNGGHDVLIAIPDVRGHGGGQFPVIIGDQNTHDFLRREKSVPESPVL